MARRFLTVFAGFAFLLGLAISAYAQVTDPPLSSYDPVSGGFQTPGKDSNCTPAAYACVQVHGAGAWADPYRITVRAGGGSHDWDLAADDYGDPGSTDVFFFNGLPGGYVFDIDVNYSDPSTWGLATNQTAGGFGTFSYAITAPSDKTDEVETLSFDFVGTLGPGFAAYVTDPGTIDAYVGSVPEPGTLMLLGSGLLGLAGLIRRRRAA